jgi:ATP-dependent DNA helicase RecG
LNNREEKFGEEKSSGKGSGKKLPDHAHESTSESIIGLMLQKPTITIPEIANNLGITTRAIEKQLKQLREKNIIRRIGGAKGGSWEVLK